jgi:ATP-dependent DNA helicase RecQ
VYRTGQRFGAGHVIDVLRGQARAKVFELGHDQLSTFGIGKGFSDVRWRSIFRQLVVHGYLNVDHNRYGALRLTGSSRALLRGEMTLALREDADKPKARSSRTRVTVNAEDEPLMEALRDERREIAEEHGVPPYVVFHDAALLDMIRLRPCVLHEMLEVSGVGQSKLQKYGQAFLDVLNRFDRSEPEASSG